MNAQRAPDANTRIRDDGAAAMRAAIDETGGREVFFAGKLDPQGMVASVRVLARGTDGAVPAIFDGLDAEFGPVSDITDGVTPRSDKE